MKNRERQLDNQRAHYRANKSAYLGRAKRRREAWNTWVRQLLNDVACRVCGETCAVCIDYHHVDPTTKSVEISDFGRRAYDQVKFIDELNKCVPLCACCHRQYHAGLLDVTFGNESKMNLTYDKVETYYRSKYNIPSVV